MGLPTLWKFATYYHCLFETLAPHGQNLKHALSPFPLFENVYLQKILKIGFQSNSNQGNTDRNFYAFCRN